MQIFERLRKSMNNIIFGKAGIQWFCASMKEVVALPSEQNVVKTFREAWWVMIFQKNKNERGQYILVLEYGAKNSKGLLSFRRVRTNGNGGEYTRKYRVF